MLGWGAIADVSKVNLRRINVMLRKYFEHKSNQPFKIERFVELVAKCGDGKGNSTEISCLEVGMDDDGAVVLGKSSLILCSINQINVQRLNQSINSS